MEEKSKQNITRDIEVKKNITIARGEWEGDSGVTEQEGGGFGWGRGENADNYN